MSDSEEREPNERLKKKQRLNLDFQSPFASPNPFSLLQETETMNTDVSTSANDATVSKSDKPPPIFISNIVNMNALLSGLSKLNPGPFKHITIDTKVKFNFETIEGYRLAIKYLESNKAEFHTYQINKERCFRVVIRGLHPTCDIKLMMEEISDMGYQPAQMLPVHHPVTKIPLPLFFLDLKPNTINESIYQVNRLYGAVVKIEPPKPKRNIIQCVRCQEYGHSKNYCYKPSRCVKCDGSHSTDKCNKNVNTPPICINCKGQHTANYRGCPVHINLQKSSQFNTRHVNMNQQSIKYTSNTVAENRASTTSGLEEGKTFASVVTQSNDSEQKDTNMIHKLMEKIDSLLSLLYPLINTLNQVLPVLINKK